MLLLLLLLVASVGEYHGVRLPGYWVLTLQIFSLVAGGSNPTPLSNRDPKMGVFVTLTCLLQTSTYMATVSMLAATKIFQR